MSNIEIWVDNRENGLRELFKNDTQRAVPIIEKNLDHGDILLFMEAKIFAIFERKTISDLQSSIIDNRYSNQKYALLNAYDRSILYYIIEGNIQYNQDTIITSAIVNTIIRDDIRIFRTSSIQDTYHLICHIYDQLLKDPGKYLEKDHYKNVLVKKEKQKSPSDFLRNVLIQVPGVSYKIAGEYVKRFKTFKEFIDVMNQFENHEKLKFLQDIKINNRSVSKTTLNNIIHFMFNGNPL